MAGGDYDGDMVSVSTNLDLIAMLEDTQEAADDNTTEEIEKNMDKEPLWAKTNTDFETENRAAEFKDFCSELDTPQLRGKACALAERAAARVLQRSTAGAVHFSSGAPWWRTGRWIRLRTTRQKQSSRQ